MAKTKIKTGGITDLNVTVAKLPAAVDISTKTVTLPASVSGLGTGITAAQLTNTLDLSSHTVTLPTSALSYPTFTSTTPSTITNDLTSLVIAGGSFGSSGIPAVEFQSSTGVITAASSVVRDSASQLTVGATLPTDGNYFIRIELNTGLAVRSTTAVLTVSDAPVWTTSSGSIGTIAGDFSGTVATVAATGDGVEYTETTDVLENAALANCTLASATGIITTTDFAGPNTAAALYTFTIRATDDQGQTADREFTLTSSFGATGGAQFNQEIIMATYISRTLGTPTDNKKWTFSAWVKVTDQSESDRGLFNVGGNASGYTRLNFAGSHQLEYDNKISPSAWDGRRFATARRRDPAAWYHIVAVFDSDNGTPADRMITYFNGERISAYDSDLDPSSGAVSGNTSGETVRIGVVETSAYFNGNMSWVQFVDGLALAPTEFGETDATSGMWKIKTDVYGTPGNNGFCLKMEDRTNLDLDSSSNAHTFTTTGTLTATYDNPDNNFCTGNQLDNYFAGGTFSQGSNTVTTTTAYGYSRCTQGVAAGKWYWENKVKNIAAPDYVIGIASKMSTSATSWLGSAGETYSYDATDGKIYNSASGTAYGDTFTDDDIIGVYLDLDNNKLYFAKNGTVQNSGTGVSITDVFSTESVTTDGVYFPGIGAWSATAGSIYEFNFGNGYFGTDLISSPEADAGGIGAFKYDPSAGTFDGSSKDFRALCTKNIKAYGG